MKDIVEKIDRMKAVASAARSDGEGPSDAETAEMVEIGFDLLGELIANSRRIAVSLEIIAHAAREIADQHGAQL